MSCCDDQFEEGVQAGRRAQRQGETERLRRAVNDAVAMDRRRIRDELREELHKVEKEEESSPRSRGFGVSGDPLREHQLLGLTEAYERALEILDEVAS